MTAVREPIYAALFNLVAEATGAATASRILRNPEDVQPSEMPALFLSQRPEKYAEPGRGLPPKRTLHALVWLYACDPQIAGVVPATQLNNMVDAVEAALAPAGTDLAMQGVQTLGGLVSHCWIEGNVEYYEGLDTNGRSVAVISVAILIP
jgi:hypothetical protein